MQPTNRQAYLDWLRILAVLGVLFFHSAMPFAYDMGWHIKNNETSHLLLEFNVWMHSFRMPLLFFISGTVSYFMLQKRTGGGFIGIRFRRLFIPLLFGMLVIVPPQVYMERLTQGYSGNFWTFYPSIFQTGPYPKGNLSWHHLWFILYLLIYDIICAPLFIWILSERGKRFLARLSWASKGKWIYLMMLPVVVIHMTLAVKYPETNNLVQDPAYFLYWLFFLLPGFICIAYPPFMNSIENNRRFSLLLALGCLVFMNYIRWNDRDPWDVFSHPLEHWQTYGWMALNPIMGWSWVLTAVGYGKRYLNKPHRIQNYCNQAVYPFYILHQTIIVILIYYVRKTSDTIGMKYAFIVGVTFVLAMGIYHVLIRPYPVARWLFGMKPLPASGTGASHTTPSFAAVVEKEPGKHEKETVKPQKISTLSPKTIQNLTDQ